MESENYGKTNTKMLTSEPINIYSVLLCGQSLLKGLSPFGKLLSLGCPRPFSNLNAPDSGQGRPLTEK